MYAMFSILDDPFYKQLKLQKHYNKNKHSKEINLSAT